MTCHGHAFLHAAKASTCKPNEDQQGTPHLMVSAVHLVGLIGDPAFLEGPLKVEEESAPGLLLRGGLLIDSWLLTSPVPGGLRLLLLLALRLQTIQSNCAPSLAARLLAQ